ncbi:MAG: hypothetical protein IT542_06590 [Rubellimicrobium sp.]|nr:hypothetical protein [Rubellimicrobium sp.]
MGRDLRQDDAARGTGAGPLPGQARTGQAQAGQVQTGPDESALRAMAFLRIERANLPSAAARSLQRRSRGERTDAVAQAMRILRGHTV